MQTISLPRAFEPDFYRETYPDLAHLTVDEALEHYRTDGIGNGYAGSPAAERFHLLSFADNKEAILEIGPFHAPSVFGGQVRYMDVLNTEGLINAVREAGHDTSRVPQIHYVAPTGGFHMVDRKFAAVFSGHCIEHQPDLVRHLQGVSSILDDDGRYYIACPDKRYCFDHYAPESTVVDILAAYYASHKVHQPRSFIVQHLHRTHNEAARHWSNNHGQQQYMNHENAKTDIFAIPRDDAYHDIHAWQFTPSSFFRMMNFLYAVRLTDLAPERVYHTRFGTQEFTAALRKGRHRFSQDEAFIEPLSGEDYISLLKRTNLLFKNEIERLRDELARAYSSRS